MQEKGLEPSWYCYHTDLNRARLPIPPFLRAYIKYHKKKKKSTKNIEIFKKMLYTSIVITEKVCKWK